MAKERMTMDREYFNDKWYIREDLYPERIDTKTRCTINCNILLEIGNCFNSREDALNRCNAIRTLIGAKNIQVNSVATCPAVEGLRKESLSTSKIDILDDPSFKAMDDPLFIVKSIAGFLERNPLSSPKFDHKPKKKYKSKHKCIRAFIFRELE